MGQQSTQVTAGIWGFLVLFFLGLACWLLFRSMNGHLRRVRYAEAERDRTRGGSAGGASVNGASAGGSDAPARETPAGEAAAEDLPAGDPPAAGAPVEPPNSSTEQGEGPADGSGRPTG